MSHIEHENNYEYELITDVRIFIGIAYLNLVLIFVGVKNTHY